MENNVRRIAKYNFTLPVSESMDDVFQERFNLSITIPRIYGSMINLTRGPPCVYCLPHFLYYTLQIISIIIIASMHYPASVSSPALSSVFYSGVPRMGGFFTGFPSGFAAAHRWIFEASLSGRVLVVDGAIRFSLFSLSGHAIGAGLNPDMVLDQVYVQRVFNPYHVLESAGNLLKKPDSFSMTFFLSPYKQLFDRDVGFEESIALSEILTKSILRIRQKNIPAVFFEKNMDHPAYRGSLGILETKMQNFYRNPLPPPAGKRENRILLKER